MAQVTAYVDESLRLEGAGLYVLAAVLVPDGRAAAVRATLRDSVPRGLRRYHWRKEGDESRRAMLGTIRALRVESVVVTRPVEPARQERARRQCLVRLLWELDQRAIAQVVLESRRSADAMDRQLIEKAHRARWTSGVRYEFGLPDRECLLWLPDVIAGAVRAAAEGDPSYLDIVRDVVLMIPAE